MVENFLGYTGYGEGGIRTRGRLLDLRLVSSEFLSTTQAPLHATQ